MSHYGIPSTLFAILKEPYLKGFYKTRDAEIRNLELFKLYVGARIRFIVVAHFINRIKKCNYIFYLNNKKVLK